jgi:hypothetical protein
MGYLLPSTLKEVYIPVEGEQELSRVRATYLSTRSRPEGDLVITTRRISFLFKPLGVIRTHTGEVPLHEALVNIGYNQYISTSVRTEKKFFRRERIIEINYETLEGLAKKALFKVKDEEIEDVIKNIEVAATRYREEEKESSALPIKLFAKFAEFLSVNKAIRPLYYDSVTRCIAIPSSYFCIKDAEWNIIGSMDIVDKARNWMVEFKNRLMGSS